MVNSLLKLINNVNYVVILKDYINVKEDTIHQFKKVLGDKNKPQLI
jgi:hypothetical protein